jgi:transposase
MRVPAAGEDAKFVVYGAVDYATGKVIWQSYERKDGEAFVAFLDHLLAAFPDGPVVVALDNVGYHKGQVARAWWRRHTARVEAFWLPAYSPELNLMERVWRFFKDKLSCHRWWADLDRLREATVVLLDRIVAKFHTENRPGIRLVQNFGELA